MTTRKRPLETSANGPMNIEQALAEALHECKAVGGPWMPCDARGECDCRSMAAAILATPAMQWPCDAIQQADRADKAEAALGRSKQNVLRMGQNWEDALAQRDKAEAIARELAELPDLIRLGLGPTRWRSLPKATRQRIAAILARFDAEYGE